MQTASASPAQPPSVPQSETRRPVVTLASVKVIKSMSEETTAYTAKILVDGVVLADASNRGQGGPDDYHPIPKDRSNLAESYRVANEAWDAAVAAVGGLSEMERIVGDLVEDHQERASILRFKASCVRKGYKFAVVVRFVGLVDDSVVPEREILDVDMSAFGTEAQADEWIAVGARKEFGDRFRSAEKERIAPDAPRPSAADADKARDARIARWRAAYEAALEVYEREYADVRTAKDHASTTATIVVNDQVNLIKKSARTSPAVLAAIAAAKGAL